jgi:hypothetical protein
MIDLKTFEKELNKAGYFVSADQVATGRGDVVGQTDPYGDFICKEEAVMDILSKPAVKEPAPKKVSAKKTKRARDEDGHFKADDPSTPDVNEAWEE